MFGVSEDSGEVAIRVIINADDLGASASINDAIDTCLHQGAVTSTTLLANGPAFEQAVEIVQKYSDCSVGVHLNAMEYAPLTRQDDLRPVLAEDGQFNGRLGVVDMTSSLRKALAIEWCAQIERIREAGITVSHLDSHYHTHTLPAMFPVLKDVIKSSLVRKVRLTKNLYSDSQPPASKSLLLKKRLWIAALRFALDVHTTESFTEFSTFFELSRLRKPDVGTIELMVHPGHDQYRDETDILTGQWEKKLNFKVELISYRDV